MELKIAYIGLTLLTLVFLIVVGFKAINGASTNIKKDKTILLLALGVWQLFILALASTDLLKSYEFPPRFAMAFIVPSFIFTGIFLYRNRHKKWIHTIPEQWIIYFQSFRVFVETLFVYSVAEGILNYQVTIEGYNFDMVFAFTAPLIALLVYNLKVLPRKIVVLWNYLGLTIISSIIFLFLSSIYKPEIYGSEVPLLPLDAFSYPYVLIAGFLMPVAVFLHILSLLQLQQKKAGHHQVLNK